MEEQLWLDLAGVSLGSSRTGLWRRCDLDLRLPLPSWFAGKVALSGVAARMAPIDSVFWTWTVLFEIRSGSSLDGGKWLSISAGGEALRLAVFRAPVRPRLLGIGLGFVSGVAPLFAVGVCLVPVVVVVVASWKVRPFNGFSVCSSVVLYSSSC